MFVNSIEDLLKQKILFDRYAQKEERGLSCYHFAAIFAWKDFFDFEFIEMDERLCVFARQGKGTFLYLPPLGGPLTEGIIGAVFKKMGKTPLARIENISDNQLLLFQERGYNVQRKADEYVYRKDDLIGLKGHAYKSQRHDYNHFTKHYSPGFGPYGDEHYKGCIALYKNWKAERLLHQRDQVYRAMLEENASVHASVIAHHRQLGLVGRVLLIDGAVVAYSFGYALDSKTFCVLFEVADLSKTGSAVYIFNRFCADDALKGFEWINTMDDFGMPNVAAAKKAFHPVRLVSSYTVSRME